MESPTGEGGVPVDSGAGSEEGFLASLFMNTHFPG